MKYCLLDMCFLLGFLIFSQAILFNLNRLYQNNIGDMGIFKLLTVPDYMNCK